MKKIIVEDYNPLWQEQFKLLKSFITDNLKEFHITIEHVGSTSVEGLAAKPILDIDIVINDDTDSLKIIHTLHKLGYLHQGDLGIKGREAFKRASAAVPYCPTNTNWMDHHLYLCRRNIPALQNHLNFREYLRNNPTSVQKYGELKKKLAKKYPYDIDSYVESKTEFIINILKKCGFHSSDLSMITEQNKNPQNK